MTFGATLMSGLATKLRLGQDHGIKLELKKKNGMGQEEWYTRKNKGGSLWELEGELLDL